MVLRISGALTLILSTVGFLNATTPATFNVTEPLSVAGVPPVTLGPGTYVIRTVDSVGGTSFVQILSKKKDYVYTTVLTIPATRLNPDGKSQILFSEAPLGNPPALPFWFPPGESRGYEFVNFPNAPIPDRSSAPAQFQLRTEGARNSPPQLEGNAADL